MNASEAKEATLKALRKLDTVYLEDIMPHIQEYANRGASEIRYMVKSNAERVVEVKNQLAGLGYEVFISNMDPSDHQAIVVRWSNPIEQDGA